MNVSQYLLTLKLHLQNIKMYLRVFYVNNDFIGTKTASQEKSIPFTFTETREVQADAQINSSCDHWQDSHTGD